MSHDEKVQENFRIILARKNKEILDLEIQRNQDRDLIKYLEERVKGLEMQIQLHNALTS